MAQWIATKLHHYGDLIKWISVVVIVVSVVALIRAFPFGHAIGAGTAWIEGLGFWGPLVYGLIYAIATVLFVPGSILTVTAGAIFGLWTGFLTTWLGSTIAAMSAFLAGRYVARQKVVDIARRYPKFDAIDRAVGEGGWKIVALVRMSPVVPFNLQNYFYGLTRIRFWPCFFATWFGMIPGTFLFVYIGHIAGAVVAGERERTVWEWIMLVVGLLATAVVTAYVTLLAKRQLGKTTELEDDEHDDSTDKEEEKPVRTQEGFSKQRKSKLPWRVLITAALAVLLAAAAVYGHLDPQAMEHLLIRIFGLPKAVTTL